MNEWKYGIAQLSLLETAYFMPNGGEERRSPQVLLLVLQNRVVNLETIPNHLLAAWADGLPLGPAQDLIHGSIADADGRSSLVGGHARVLFHQFEGLLGLALRHGNSSVGRCENYTLHISIASAAQMYIMRSQSSSECRLEDDGNQAAASAWQRFSLEDDR